MIPESGTVVSLSTGGWIAAAHFERRSLLQFPHTRSKKQGFLPSALQRAGWCAVMCAGEQGSSVCWLFYRWLNGPHNYLFTVTVHPLVFLFFCFFVSPFWLRSHSSFPFHMSVNVKMQNWASSFCHSTQAVIQAQRQRHWNIIFFLLFSGNVWYPFACKHLIPWRESVFNLPVFVFRISLVIKCSHKFFRNPWEEILVVIHLQWEVCVSRRQTWWNKWKWSLVA